MEESKYIVISGEWKSMELSIPRADLGLIDDSFVFDFKWTDNPANLKDPISLCRWRCGS